MNKLYYYEIPGHPESSFNSAWLTIEECVEACKTECLELGVDYDDPRVKLYFTEDFCETFEECTEEGELAG